MQSYSQILGVTSTEAQASDEAFLDTSQGVDVPRLIPEEVLQPDGQPDEENQIPEAPRNANVADVVKAKAWDALGLRFNGEIWVDENTMGKICILCGSPGHVFSGCRIANPLRQQITDVFEHVRKAIVEHPDVITFQEAESEPASPPHRGERASGSNDQMDVESVASSGRRPKAKARPRHNNLQQTGGVFIIRYENGKNLSEAVHRSRGDWNFVCGENISEMGPQSHDELLSVIQTSSCPRDHKIPQRGDPSLYPRIEGGGYENPAYEHIPAGRCLRRYS